MLVALPAAIGYGLTVMAPLGPAYAMHGAWAGIVGTVVLGLVAAGLGGTARLISAPCAPAAAVLAAFSLEMVRRGDGPTAVLLSLALLGVLAGVLQLVLAYLGVGRLIRFIPYPVVSGYLTGVGLTLIGSQAPKLLGLGGAPDWLALRDLPWDWRPLLVGAVTVAAVVLGSRSRSRVPSTIWGLGLGLMAYGVLALLDPTLRHWHNNPLLLGAVSAGGKGFVQHWQGTWASLLSWDWAHTQRLLGTALILAVLLSIDTLKTCAVLDQLTRSHHQPNRELRAQGWANALSATLGGLVGAGTAGPSLVALKSQASTRATGALHGVLALAAALLLGPFLAWLPVATLAGLLVGVGWLMIDREPLRYLRSPATVLDFGVVLVVVAVALSVGLIAAAAVGVALSMLLFVRGQSAAPVVRHRLSLEQAPSTWHRPRAEREALHESADQAVVLELQGSLFFGNANRLALALEQESARHAYVVVDLQHVPSIDVTALEMFHRHFETLRERGVVMVLCGASERRSKGHHLAVLLDSLQQRDPQGAVVRVVPELDDAIAWVESRLLHTATQGQPLPGPLAVREIEMFAHLPSATLQALETVLEVQRYAAGDTLYRAGMPGHELYWVRQGVVRLMATVDAAGTKRQVAGFGRGDHFGGLAFLDQEPRPNDAVAAEATEVFVLTRSAWQGLIAQHPELAFDIHAAMARTLATRLRRVQSQLLALQEH
jgi:SulP family sulfate permease